VSVESVWYSDTRGARLARAALTPLSWLYRGGVALRNRLYDTGRLRAHDGGLPVISIGNLTVGGTGKTPVTAYVARVVRDEGHTPAVVLRGYGNDETRLHARLTPGAPVVADADRVRGIAEARRQGASVVVLDDAFQHRRAARCLDVVLVSADRWKDGLRLLPAGPLREPIASVRRARLVIVTRKAASLETARRVAERVRKIAGVNPTAIPVAIVSLVPEALVDWHDASRRVPIHELRGADVLAIAGIGDPSSFFAQLEESGATVTRRAFADHHAYTPAEAAELAGACARHKYCVTTEKDAVKLGPAWPAKGGTLWYVSQAVVVNDGGSLITAALRDALSRRFTQPAG
jgi:tetraacyldisaccharide 4'-kinase